MKRERGENIIPVSTHEGNSQQTQDLTLSSILFYPIWFLSSVDLNNE